MSALAAVASLVALVPFHGWVGSTLWRWFLQPLGAPHIGIMQACGIVLTVHFFAVPTDLKKADAQKWWIELLKVVFRGLLFLGLGAIYHAVSQ